MGSGDVLDIRRACRACETNLKGAEPVDTQSELGVLAGGLIWIEVEVPVDPFVNEGNEDLKRHSQQEEDNDEPAPARQSPRRCLTV